jgi:hypothetical protein
MSRLAKAFPVTLDRERSLKFDLNALAALEDVLGRSVLGDGGMDLKGARELRAFFWAGLLHEDPSLTIEQVGAMMDGPGAVEMTLALGEAIRGSLPATSRPTGAGEEPADGA